MIGVLLLLAIVGRCGAKLCQAQSPTASLFEEMRMCRELNFPFCVEASIDNLLAAKQAISDLPTDIADAALSEVSAMAVVADRYLTLRYKKLIDESEPSQTCLHHWRMAVCSETFSSLGAPSALCYATCKAVQTHCTAQFLTPDCDAMLQYGDPTSGAACTDYASLVSDDTCVIGDAPRSLVPQPQPAGIVPVSNSPTIGGQAGNINANNPVVAAAGGGGGGGGASPNYYQPIANGAPRNRGKEIRVSLELLTLALVVFLFRT